MGFRRFALSRERRLSKVMVHRRLPTRWTRRDILSWATIQATAWTVGFLGVFRGRTFTAKSRRYIIRFPEQVAHGMRNRRGANDFKPRVTQARSFPTSV